MSHWYRFETGNDRRKEIVARHLRRSGLHFEIEDASKRMRCDCWVFKIWLTDYQAKDLNTWLRGH